MRGEYEDQKAVARANRAFYTAFEWLDLATMAELWHRAEDVRCVHPGGEWIQGYDKVLATWRAIFQSTRRVRFDLEDLIIDVFGDLGLVTGVERLRLEGAGEPISSSAAVTNAFVRCPSEDGGEEWRMVLHHASPVARRFFREGEA